MALNQLLIAQTEQQMRDTQNSNNGFINSEIALKADKAYVDTEIAAMVSGSPKGVYATLVALQAALPTGDSGIYVISGNTKEVDTLSVTGAPSSSNNVTITLNGVAKTVAVLSTDNTTGVATKIRAATFTGWTTGGTGTEVSFTNLLPGVVIPPVFSAGTTGSTATFAVSTLGSTYGDWYFWNGAAWTYGGVYLATKIADNTLTPNMLDRLYAVATPGKNLFDKSTALPNSYITASGVVTSASGFYASDFISINPSSAIYKNPYNSVAWYDASKIFISLSTAGVRALTSPANAYYVRITISPTDPYKTIDTAQVELGTVETAYASYTTTITVSQISNFLSTMLTQQLSDANFILPLYYKTIPNKNLFVKTTVISGKYISHTDGAAANAAGYYASDWIAVLPNTAYHKNTYDQIAFYTSNKVFISGIANANYSFTTPANAYFTRMAINASPGIGAGLESAQLEIGNAETVYETGLPIIRVEQITNLPTSQLGDNVVIVAKAGGNYTTIQAAVDAIVDSSITNRYTILIAPGIYEEAVSINDKYIDLVALDLGSVTITEKSGQYYTPPIEMSSRNNLKNLIVIAAHDNVGGYTGEPSYAIHHDFAGEGENYIENCKLISYQSCAFGCGSHNNQQIHLKNCEIITDTTGVTYTSATRPALLFHPNVYTATNQKLIVDNCRIKSNVSKVLSIIDSNNNGTIGGATADNRDTEVSFYNNIFWNPVTGKTDVVYAPDTAITQPNCIDGYILLTGDSFGNNIIEVNA